MHKAIDKKIDRALASFERQIRAEEAREQAEANRKQEQDRRDVELGRVVRKAVAAETSGAGFIGARSLAEYVDLLDANNVWQAARILKAIADALDAEVSR